ncbi:unnamed protein product [Cladocopium goreaui]|uniref:Uncharacterized protein n=1 Tax=Cladocopium goreaui TaxID=2562237 RepID=A0A9P1GRL3_9DINO|nr:unnamed protein product [Cladocopium goreaui]
MAMERGNADRMEVDTGAAIPEEPDHTDNDNESEWVDIPEGDAAPQTPVAMSDDEWVDIPEWDAAPQTPPQLTGVWLDGVAVPHTPPELLLAPPEQLALLAPWTPPGPPPQTPPEAYLQRRGREFRWRWGCA